ncbi:hypothetical protein RUM44_009670 [Polyplax serrata]|uniref:FLYWCH-type domain-containing protein n=2 Tax=Polyplax serrata TaxID=468196 RepID=A0ABR1ATC0_POLSC
MFFKGHSFTQVSRQPGAGEHILWRCSKERSINYMVSTTARGKPCILMDGYKYLCHILNKKQPNKYWQCDRYLGKQPACKVRALLKEDGRFCLNGPHNHPPNPSLIHTHAEIPFFINST